MEVTLNKTKFTNKSKQVKKSSQKKMVLINLSKSLMKKLVLTILRKKKKFTTLKTHRSFKMKSRMTNKKPKKT